jgi:hypothetical protein
MKHSPSPTKGEGERWDPTPISPEDFAKKIIKKLFSKNPGANGYTRGAKMARPLFFQAFVAFLLIG